MSRSRVLAYTATLALPLIASLMPASATERSRQPPSATLRISLLSDQALVRGSSMPIQCTFSNASKHSTSLLLKLFRANGTALDVPWYAEARITDDHGRAVTRDGLRPGWWSANVLSSEACIQGVGGALGEPCELPGDRITLHPGQSVRRVIALDRLLLGSPSLDPGSYRLQLRWGDILSQELPITIAEARGA